jgi:hypothetical protein
MKFYIINAFLALMSYVTSTEFLLVEFSSKSIFNTQHLTNVEYEILFRNNKIHYLIDSAYDILDLEIFTLESFKQEIHYYKGKRHYTLDYIHINNIEFIKLDEDVDANTFNINIYLNSFDTIRHSRVKTVMHHEVIQALNTRKEKSIPTGIYFLTFRNI